MATYTIVWTATNDVDERKHEVDAASEQEARAKFQDYLKTHYEDEYKDEGVKIISVRAK